MSIVGDIVGGLTSGAAGATPTGAITAVSGLAQSIVERIWPDPTEQAKAKLALAQMTESGELQRLTIESGLLRGQQEINLADAKSGSWWQGGWRPAIGWVCAVALACLYIPRALITVGVWAAACWQAGAIVSYPDLGAADLLALTGTMLGASWMRTQEKKAGVA